MCMCATMLLAMKPVFAIFWEVSAVNLSGDPRLGELYLHKVERSEICESVGNIFMVE